MTTLQATDTTTPATLLDNEQPLCTTYDAALLDLDGVCFADQARVPHAASSVNTACKTGIHLSFVTSNVSWVPQMIVDKLANNDIIAEASEVFSVAMDAAAMLAEYVEPGSMMLVVGGDGVRQVLLDKDSQVTNSAQDGPVAVAQGWDPAVGWALLFEGVCAISAGALHVTTSLGAALSTERGFALGNDSLVAAIAYVFDKEPLVGGRPFPGIYMRALKRAGGTRPLAIGDRPNTDHVGARAIGILGLRTLTGVSDARGVICAPAARRPNFLRTDLRGLTGPHPEPVRAEVDGQVWWKVCDRSARVLGSQLELQDFGAATPPDDSAVRVNLDFYRVLAVVAWDQTDVQGRQDKVTALEMPKIEMIKP